MVCGESKGEGGGGGNREERMKEGESKYFSSEFDRSSVAAEGFYTLHLTAHFLTYMY